MKLFLLWWLLLFALTLPIVLAVQCGWFPKI